MKDVVCSFRSGVATLIYGENMDNDSQKSNGSGKSSLIESIAFVLTGSPLRNVKNDELINNDEDSATVSITLHNTSSDTIIKICRTIFRKGSPNIKVDIIKDGLVVNDGSTVKSGVDEYNKYILELLGLTKDEIYNNYILSKHKYQDFLSASDREKKEIINKFSRGNLVDQSIEALQIDKQPLQISLSETQLELSNIDGRISALEEQIDREKNSLEINKQNKIERIADARAYISAKQNEIETLKEKLNQYDTENIQFKRFKDKLNDIGDESNNDEFNDCIDKLRSLLSEYPCFIFPLTDYEEKVSGIENLIKEAQANLERVESEVSLFKDKFKTFENQENKIKKKLDLKQEDLNQFKLECDSKIEKIKIEEEKVGEQLIVVRSKLKDSKAEIAKVEAIIAGAIECPHCAKQFVLKDKSFNVESGKQRISTLLHNNRELELNITSLLKAYDSFGPMIDKIHDDYRERSKDIQAIQNELQQIQREIAKLSNDYKSKCDEVESQKKKIISIKQKPDQILDDLFENLFDEVDRRNKKIAGDMKGINETISSYDGIIKTKEELIDKLENEDDENIIVSLQKSNKEYKKKRAVIYKKQNDLEAEIKELEAQEARFIAFKTHLANSKVEALNEITNGFLEQIGSDLRVKFDGYTKLKSGKIKDKISVSLLRDGIDTGSFSKFSEGEKTRIQLATILAMNSLTNNNADNDKGLDLLILDEILAPVDEEGLTNILESLNKLKITSMVVSHGKTAEAYPHKLVITKQNGISTING